MVQFFIDKDPTVKIGSDCTFETLSNPLIMTPGHDDMYHEKGFDNTVYADLKGQDK